MILRAFAGCRESNGAMPGPEPTNGRRRPASLDAQVPRAVHSLRPLEDDRLAGVQRQTMLSPTCPGTLCLFGTSDLCSAKLQFQTAWPVLRHHSALQQLHVVHACQLAHV